MSYFTKVIFLLLFCSPVEKLLKQNMDNDIRIDKYLWATRVYKTRTEATEACRNEKVIVNNLIAKPSRIVRTGDIIEIRVNPIIKKFRVLNLLKNRCSAKLAPEFLEDLTDPAELERLKTTMLARMQNKGLGRPTKKDRRLLSKIDITEPDENNEHVQ